ncbi:hypothetical protein SLE2022_398050 [Rubroshorea leprosula]
MIFRAFSSVSRNACARFLLISAPRKLQPPGLTNQLHSLIYESPIKASSNGVSLIHYSAFNPSIFQRFGIASSATPEPSDKDGSAVENNGQENTEQNGDVKVSGETKDMSSEGTEVKVSGSSSESQPESVKKRRRGTQRTAFSDSDSDSESDEDLSMDDMVKLVVEKDELLKVKQKEIGEMKDKVVRTLAEMENVMARTRREAENSKKFAIQNFAKSMLDVADNLGRASAHVKGSFSKIDESNDTAGAVPLLKTLLEGVEMTDKQLLEVFRKFGVEKFDPMNEPFDPHRHNAVFQVPDNSKPSGTVAHVLKAGYMLYDRVIRPAEVGVTQAPDNDTSASDGGEKGYEA